MKWSPTSTKNECKRLDWYQRWFISIALLRFGKDEECFLLWTETIRKNNTSRSDARCDDFNNQRQNSTKIPPTKVIIIDIYPCSYITTSKIESWKISGLTNQISRKIRENKRIIHLAKRRVKVVQENRVTVVCILGVPMRSMGHILLNRIG